MAVVGEREVYPHSLAIENYKHGNDFDEWVVRFELAVELAHNVADPDKRDKRDEHCLKWLPVKIDPPTWTLYRGITTRVWEEAKKQLSALLTDPQEKYDWFAGRNPIVWDGKESFQSLAMRIKLKIDKHVEESAKPRELFQRFRGALDKEYRRAIDLGCGDKWDIEEAKRIATRLRLADGDAAASAASEGKSVTFTGAAMSDDRIKSVEMALQGISVKVDNLCETMEKNQRSREPSYSRDRSDRGYSDRRSPSQGRDGRDYRGRRDSFDRDRRSSYDGRRGGDRYRAVDYRDSSDDRSRRDSYEYDRRGRDDYRRSSYGRRPSYERRDDYRRSPSPRYRSPGYRRDYDRSSDRRSSFDRRPRFDRSPSYQRRYDDSRYDRRDDSRDRDYRSRDRWQDRERRDSRGSDGKYSSLQDGAPYGTLAIESPTTASHSSTDVDPQMKMLAATLQKCLRPNTQEN